MYTKEAETWLQHSLDKVFVWTGRLYITLLSDIYETVIKAQLVVGDLCSILKEMQFFLYAEKQLDWKQFQFMTKVKKTLIWFEKYFQL